MRSALEVERLEIGQVGGEAAALARDGERRVAAGEAVLVEMRLARADDRLRQLSVRFHPLATIPGGNRLQHFGAATISLSSARAAPAACSPTACRRIRKHRVLLLEAGGQRRLVLDRYPGRLPLHHRQPAHRLVLQDRARRAPRRTLDPLRARPRARRLLVDQRHDLHARPAGGLGPLGGARQPRLVLGRRAAHLQALEDYERGPIDGYGAGGEVRVENPRVRWDIIDAWREAAAECGIPPVEGVQQRRQLRLRLLPDEPEARPALERHQRVPAPCRFTARTSPSSPTPMSSRLKFSWERLRSAFNYAAEDGSSKDMSCRGEGGNHPRRRRDRLAAAPAALGHRRRAAC